ncbi:MAG: hypothetical protein ACREEE_16055, partial [Dongiaceae bacterium]
PPANVKPEAGAAGTAIEPTSGVNFRAFDRRLLRIYLIAFSSANYVGSPAATLCESKKPSWAQRLPTIGMLNERTSNTV